MVYISNCVFFFFFVLNLISIPENICQYSRRNNKLLFIITEKNGNPGKSQNIEKQLVWHCRKSLVIAFKISTAFIPNVNTNNHTANITPK